MFKLIKVYCFKCKKNVEASKGEADSDGAHQNSVLAWFLKSESNFSNILSTTQGATVCKTDAFYPGQIWVKLLELRISLMFLLSSWNIPKY